MSNKSELRKKYKQIRSSLEPDFRRAASNDICGFVCALEEYKKASVVFVYSSVYSEVSTQPIICDALSHGKTVLLPVTDAATETMHASEIKSENDIVCGAYGIAEPKDKTAFDTEKIDLVIVPGLAFNKQGYRIGYGKGYYDKFLSQNGDIVKIGVAFSAQLCEENFEAAFDVRLDVIVTEKGVIFCEDS